MAVVNAIEDRIIGVPFKVEVKSASVSSVMINNYHKDM